MGGTDDQRYQQVPGHENPKSYLCDGRKDSNRSLGLKIY